MTVPELSADDLLRALESGQGPQVLDLRAPQHIALGHITAPEYRNVPGSQLGRFADPAEAGLDRTRPIAVVCDRGNSSRQVTAWLRAQGFQASSLAGGMLSWMGAVARREVSGLLALDRLIQFDRIGKGALGYLALSGGEALAVDPGRDLAPWLAALDETGARLVMVVDTHAHADYLSGAPALAGAAGVPYRLHPADAIDPYENRKSPIAFEPLTHGESLAVGDARFVVEHFPGHTAGSVALRLGDELALTGDFVFVASIGRPDLADRTAEWTELLWASLERAKGGWADSLRILPAHYAAECERGADRVVEGRFGALRRSQGPLAIADLDGFRGWVAERVGDYPEAYRWIKCANLGLAAVDADLADELEAGRNQCALAT